MPEIRCKCGRIIRIDGFVRSYDIIKPKHDYTLKIRCSSELADKIRELAWSRGETLAQTLEYLYTKSGSLDTSIRPSGE